MYAMLIIMRFRVRKYFPKFDFLSNNDFDTSHTNMMIVYFRWTLQSLGFATVIHSGLLHSFLLYIP